MKHILSLTLLMTALGAAEQASIAVQVNQPGARINPTLYGIFFEEINCSGDGGLFSELVRNRSFEDSDKPDHWSLVTGGSAMGSMAMDAGWPVGEFNPRSLKLTIKPGGDGRVGIANDGWWGMGLKAGEEYVLSFNAKAGDGFSGAATASLESSGFEHSYAEARIDGIGSEWQRHTVTLKASADIAKAGLVLSATKPGSLTFDFVSLMPKTTFLSHGLRPDLAHMLADLKPGFLRFPGGCWVEGERMELAMRWKTTIGDPALRRTQYNIWQYMSTNGLGYHEYLQFCEDLGTAGLFVFNCGMSHQENVPMDKMGPYVQDAVDAIEYAIGPVDSQWGALRVKAGHPQPFNLKYVEIGNENGGPAYNERYALFFDAIRAKYPQLRLVANDRVTSRPMDIIDEHYYPNAEWFMHNADKYDSYDRKGPKVFVGEYAVIGGGGEGNLKAAVGEAAFMTGLERNGDLIELASYAPLFANVNYKKWNPDLICFDSTQAYGIPSYYVQQMFSANRGDVVLPVALEQPALTTLKSTGAIGVATWQTTAEYKDMVVTKGDQVLWKSDLSAGQQGWRFEGGDWKVVDGALRQLDRGNDRRALAGDENWDDYVFSLKARKIEGVEGFRIMCHVKDGSYVLWNIGGWGNTQDAIEMSSISDPKPGKVESGRWYDIRVEMKDGRVRCFLDNEKIHDLAVPVPKPIYVVASRIEASNELVLKVVNASVHPIEADVDLRGTKTLGTTAILTQLSSGNPMDENSLAEPRKVTPVIKTVEISGPRFKQALPAWSVTVLRMKGQ